MNELLLYIDYLGTFVFAITGATIAARSDCDFFGMLFLSFLTAVGGGTVRDIILDQTVFWTIAPIYLYIITSATILTFFFVRFFEKNSKGLLILDTLGMGTFVIIGTQKALALSSTIETAIIMGTISAVLGGIFRSIFSREYSILVNRELYATVAAAGALTFSLSQRFGLHMDLSIMMTLVITFSFRFIALKYKIKLPSLNH